MLGSDDSVPFSFVLAPLVSAVSVPYFVVVPSLVHTSTASPWDHVALSVEPLSDRARVAMSSSGFSPLLATTDIVYV